MKGSKWAKNSSSFGDYFRITASEMDTVDDGTIKQLKLHEITADQQTIAKSSNTIKRKLKM